LPIVPTKKMIHCTVTVVNVNAPIPEDDPEGEELVVVSVLFQPFVSSILLSFADDIRLVFNLACTQSRLFCAGGKQAFCTWPRTTDIQE